MLEMIFILFIGLFGIPAVLAVGQSAIDLGRISVAAWRQHPWRTCFGWLLFGVVASAVVLYLMVFVGEVMVQATCAGAGCAQGGVGLMIFSPLPWLSVLGLFVLQKLVFNGSFLPRLANPDFDVAKALVRQSPP